MNQILSLAVVFIIALSSGAFAAPGSSNHVRTISCRIVETIIPLLPASGNPYGY